MRPSKGLDMDHYNDKKNNKFKLLIVRVNIKIIIKMNNIADHLITY